ncbi:hypothetical protein DCC62_05995 [candidate division KSB1 bacterium]|nr:MAG: hypothetical protein DCC62_05995 [candidate division KSB1 bacterium]
MQIVTTKTFDGLFKALDKKIQHKAAQKTELFKQNPFHSTLRTEKLHPKAREVWSFRVDLNYRIVFKFTGPDVAELRFIGHHNQIYDYVNFLK